MEDEKEIHRCEQCGNEHDGSYGSGRFCSYLCKMHYISAQSAKSRKTTKFPRINGRLPYGTWKCNKCNLIFETKQQLKEHNHQKHPIPKGSSWNKGLTKETDERVKLSGKTYSDRVKTGQIIPVWKGKHLSKQHRLNTSLGMKKSISNGIALGWKSQKKQSYPEIYWTNVLKSHNVNFEYQKLVPKYRYFLDFEISLDNGLKIDLEIDGKQHDDRKNNDELRDKRNRQLGYLIYRVKWNNVSTEIGQMKMQAKINQFFWWLCKMKASL